MRNVYDFLCRASMASGVRKAWISLQGGAYSASHSAQGCMQGQRALRSMSVGRLEGFGYTDWSEYTPPQTSMWQKYQSRRSTKEFCCSNFCTSSDKSGWMPSNSRRCPGNGVKTSNLWNNHKSLSDGSSKSLTPLEFLDTLINYEKIGLPKTAVDPVQKQLTVDRTKNLLGLLGNPQKTLKVVHVVGSKGKGSTCALIGAILHACGLKVGVYTSPHVNELNERIHLSGGVGSPISTSALEEAIEGAREAISDMRENGSPPSFFEALTAIALKKFADERVDIAIVEAGIGGRTDATNIFEPDNLCAAVVTPIAKEHLEHLGGSLESIAMNKAGVFKSKRPVIVSDDQHEVVDTILREQASSLDCDYISVNETVSVETLHTELQNSGVMQEMEISMKGSWEGTARMWSARMKTGMLGNHQNCNIAAAVKTIFELYKQGYVISPEAVSKGLSLVQVPGRFQVFRPNEGSPWILLDGAHTKESAAALVQTMKQIFSPQKPVALVVAMMQGKDFSAVLNELAQLRPVAAVFTKVLAFGGQRSMPPGSLVAYWEIAEAEARQPGQSSHRCRKTIQASISSAIHKALTEVSGVSKDGVVCVTGSLYAVSDALVAVEHP